MHTELEHLRQRNGSLSDVVYELKRFESVAAVLQTANASLTSQLADQADYLSTLVDYIKSSADGEDGVSGSIALGRRD